MSANHKPICAYHGNGLFLSFVVSHAERATTGLQEHRYFHTGICVYFNYVNNSIEIQLGKKNHMTCYQKCYVLLHSGVPATAAGYAQARLELPSGARALHSALLSWIDPSWGDQHVH